MSQLEAEPNPGRATPSFFSYPHFCVIVSKFQALDADGDGLIDRHDLRRHADGGEVWGQALGWGHRWVGPHLGIALSGRGLVSRAFGVSDICMH